uniref:Uncharacterized protein n=1 Tax=uncultured marine virus TaxID=186617 RepID=A0A0F7L3N1_9VIRU|nr:hypothetical protein [uncultured marine virus]
MAVMLGWSPRTTRTCPRNTAPEEPPSPPPRLPLSLPSQRPSAAASPRLPPLPWKPPRSPESWPR